VGQGFQLVYQAAGKRIVREFDQPRVLLGRSIVCDVVFDSPDLSRKHAEIVREGEAWIIEDLKSRHGVAVNGRRTTRRELADGDHLTLAPDSAGLTLLDFRLAEAVKPPPPVAILSDGQGPTSVIASIDLRELSCALERSAGPERSPLELHQGTSVGDILASPAGGRHGPMVGRAFGDSASQLPVLSMFKSAGEILLVHEGLDDLLQQVVNLIAVHFPGRRGAACLVDPASGDFQPRCFSQEPLREAEARHAPAPPPRQPFLISRSILQEAVRIERAVLVASAPDDPRFHAAVSIAQLGIRSAICVPLYHQGHVTGLIYVDSQRDAGPLDGRDLELLTVLGLMVAAGIARISLRNDVERERAMRDRLARYNSPRVVEQIMKFTPRQENEMLAEEYEVSVLFADLTGFSLLAENWTAAETVRMLNLVFERWTANVFQRDGTLDKYIGDAVMAVFGAPLPLADHARRAVDTALAMQRTLDELNRQRGGEAPLQLRIGINSGRVIAGDIGSPLHKAYTVVGDVVNIASRLETTIAQPGQIVIGEATCELLKNEYACEPLGELQLRGKRQPIRAFRVTGEGR
jgi:adenylate cyclase